MAYTYSYDQLNTPTEAGFIKTFPAGTTLVKAKMRITLSWSVTGAPTLFPPFAPPNLITGIWWGATGVTIPIVTIANSTNAGWYRTSEGVTDHHAEAVAMFPSGNWQVTRVETYTIEKEEPNFQSGSQDIGISWNWLGFGFYGINPWVSYDAEFWTY